MTRTVYEYLDCGRLHGGFARIRCPKCHGEHLLAFSCQTRNFCPSCQAKRAALFGEQLVMHTLADVPHRHVVFTIPKALRGLFHRDRRLLGLLTRCAHACVQTLLREVTGHPRAQVGMVNALQTFGSYAANFHPHVHALVTDGVFLPDGSFERVWHWDQQALTELFRRMVLAALRREQRLTEETHLKLLSWQHAGVARVICETSLGLGDSAGRLGLIYTCLIIPLVVPLYFWDKARQERILASSRLSWVIVRPAALTNGPKRGPYRHGPSIGNYLWTRTVSRADVADFMLNQLASDPYLRAAPGVCA